MRERPILFSGLMVQAILAGRKTQTRRVVKPQPGADIDPDVLRRCRPMSRGKYQFIGTDDGHEISIRCPFAVDRLWVKETWQRAAKMGVCNAADDYIIYRATDPDWETTEGWIWRPSIFMPRWASRITLELTGVRVERVQGISEWDVRAEGLSRRSDGPNIVAAYRLLWNLLNTKRGYSWKENPWVWVLEFIPAGNLREPK